MEISRPVGWSFITAIAWSLCIAAAQPNAAHGAGSDTDLTQQRHQSAIDRPGYASNQPPLYYVDITRKKVHHISETASAASNVVNITDKEGRHLRCELPGMAQPMKKRKLRRRRTLALPDLRTTTRKLFGTCHTWGEGQYWTYEVCHGNTRSASAEFFLGRAPFDQSDDARSEHCEARYSDTTGIHIHCV